MNPNHDPIRKAAVFLACLDTETADALIEQMETRQAHVMRQALMALDDVGPEEQQAVIDEFIQRESGDWASKQSGVELAIAFNRQPIDAAGSGESPAQAEADRAAQTKTDHPAQTKTDLAAHTKTDKPGDPAAEDARPFEFLRSADPETLAPCLENEQPQTIAFVVSHLSPDRAAELLSGLPPGLQAEVIERLVHLDETDPEILREVERVLQERVAQAAHRSGRGKSAAAAMTAILESATGRDRRQLLANLAERNPDLARRFKSPELTYRDLTQLDDRTLAKLFATCELSLAILALVGSEANFVDRVLAQTPPREAKLLRRAIAQLGPTRLSDIEEAKRQLVVLAQALEAEGDIDLPRRSQMALIA